MSDFYDKELTCLCGADFVWTRGEQEFMESLYEQGKIKNVIQPKRCESCRLQKKREKEFTH
jgi:hypothetical protein